MGDNISTATTAETDIAPDVAKMDDMKELLRRMRGLMQRRFLMPELFAVTAIHYPTVTTTWGAAQRWIEWRFGRPFAAQAGTAAKQR